jgi:hypothetical protein
MAASNGTTAAETATTSPEFAGMLQRGNIKLRCSDGCVTVRIKDGM